MPARGAADVSDVMTALLNFARLRKKPAAPPPPTLRPPLPAKLLAELVGLDAMRSRRLDDRRRRPRLDRASEIMIDVELPTGRVTLAAQVGDMSAEGISFDANTSLPPGTPFHTTLAQVNGEAAVELTGAVRRCESQPDGRFFIGGAFVEYRVYPITI
jgi:hypothetical protein